MESNTARDNQYTDTRTDIESLPLELQKWCLSGKSVEELAHLAKNIIQTVSGSTEIMELGLETNNYDHVQRSWTLFEPNLRRLLKFVLDLIKFTRHYPVEKTDCDLNMQVRQGICRAESLLKKHDVCLRLDEDADVPLMQLDTQRLAEIVENLIMHAMDNLPDHHGTIHIRTRFLPDHHQVQLTVTDDGPLLAKSDIRSLNVPFERTSDMCGTGFDIPLVKITVELHGGYMEFESTSELGNCVHVYLPVD